MTSTPHAADKTMAENNRAFWVLTYDYFSKDINKSEDSLIVLAHWLLLKNNFRALGPGNENVIDENEQPTDFLPTNWSQDMTYKLRYVRDNNLFLLNGVKAGDSFIFNFYNVTIKQVSSAALGNVCATVQAINDMTNNIDHFHETMNLLQTNLIDPMQKENYEKKVASTQTHPKQSEISTESPLLISRTGPNNYISSVPRMPFPSYGMPDLDPLGGLRSPGGGMIFDPLRVENGRSGFPGVPPMARFDPIRPPNPDPMMPGNFRRPNPDHMRPPDFDDNMYL